MSNEYFLNEYLKEEEKEKVFITREEYEDLLKDAETLQKLYAGGVEDWEWYEESLSV